MDVRTLVTVEALILAGLLTWAQLWVHTYDTYKAAGDPIWHISLSLSWIYAAVLASLASIIAAVYSLATGGSGLNRHALGLAGFSASLLAIMVIFSVVSAWWKALKGWSEWHPALPLGGTTQAFGVTSGATILGIALFFFCIFWLGRRLERRLSKSI